MGRDIAAHLANGHRLKMLNPGRHHLPDILGDVNALFIDREGTGLSTTTTQKLIFTATARGLASVIRADGLKIQELLMCRHAAPDAVVLPQITSARQLASAVRFFKDSNVAIIAQIETVEAVERLDRIISVPDVIAYLIGPNDLATAMGHDGAPDHPHVQATVEAVARRLKQAGRVFGLPMLNAKIEEHWDARGAQLQYLPIKAFLEMEEVQ